MKNKFFLLALLFITGMAFTTCSSARSKSSTSSVSTNTPAATAALAVETGEEEEEEEDDNAFVVELPPPGSDLPVSEFPEIWAYVIADRESALRPGMPISDVGYFGAEINSYGALVDVPDRKKLRNYSGRVHLVVACNGRALSHFVLKPGSDERRALIADLINATKNFDGLQIDFENIPQRDGDPYLTFLKELRVGIGNKMFTVALAARTRKVADDVYDYEKILPVVDRILVMAYDEHWSTSAAGPIASLPWCKRIAEYSLKVIGKEKLIMGLPFYGRGWGNPNHSQAYIYTTVERVIKENNVKTIRRENGIPAFDYNPSISVKVYFEDEYSLSARMEMYRTMGVNAIGFWRLGQETPAVWPYIKLGMRN
jgi:spore germination protein YaaH